MSRSRPVRTAPVEDEWIDVTEKGEAGRTFLRGTEIRRVPGFYRGNLVVVAADDPLLQDDEFLVADRLDEQGGRCEYCGVRVAAGRLACPQCGAPY